MLYGCRNKLNWFRKTYVHVWLQAKTVGLVSADEFRQARLDAEKLQQQLEEKYVERQSSICIWGREQCQVGH